MYEAHSVFHQSYYEHSCSVMTEKDVLYTDVTGRAAALRCWWHNLFLLSYSDPRCHIYYVSSQAMRIERSRHFRNYYARIHPLSLFTTYWNIWISFIFIFNKLSFTLACSIINGQPLWAYYICMVLELMVIFDIYISFKTGYINKEARRIILNKTNGMLRFASSKFFLHTLAAFPLQNLLYVRYGRNVTCVLCKANVFVQVLKIFSIFGLYRCFETTGAWIKEGQSFDRKCYLKIIRILVLGIITMLQYQIIADTVVILLVMITGEVRKDSRIAIMLSVKYIYSFEKWNRDSFLIAVEFSKTFKSLFMEGFGFMPQAYFMDILTGLVGFLLANMFFFWLLMEIMTVVQRTTYSEDKMLIHMDMNINMMRCRQLSDRISAKVLDYYHFNMSKFVVIEKVNHLYQLLPTSIINELKLTCYSKLMKSIPYFSEWPAKIVEDLVLLLKENMYLPNDIVADSWTKGEGLIIIHTGVAAVYASDRTEEGHLIDGDYFGELSLVTDNEIRTSFVIATDYCKTLLLDKNAFRRYMRSASPDYFFKIRTELKKKYTDTDAWLGDGYEHPEEAPQ